MKRCFRLVGDQIDIGDIAFLLRGEDRKIYNEDGFYYYFSRCANEAPASNAALEIAKEEIHILNGAAAFFYKNHHRVGIDSYIEIDGNGKKHYALIAGTVKGRSRARATVFTSEQKPFQISNQEKWLILSKTNTRVRDVLHFFNDVTWWNLYKIYEAIREEIGQKLVDKLISAHERKRFTTTANSRDAVGDFARHAEYKPAPAKPMTLDEGYILIKNLFEKWVSTLLSTASNATV